MHVKKGQTLYRSEVFERNKETNEQTKKQSEKQKKYFVMLREAAKKVPPLMASPLRPFRSSPLPELKGHRNFF